MAKDKKTPKKASELFHNIMKASVSENPKPNVKAKKQKWILTKSPFPIPLTTTLIFLYGFERIKRGVYLQDGIEIISSGGKFHSMINGKKKYVSTVQEMCKLYTDAGKTEPEIVDL